MTLAVGCLVAWAMVANGAAAGAPLEGRVAAAFALAAGFGPVAIAVAFTLLFKGSSQNGTPMFSKKQPVWASVMHLAVGTAMCSYPVAVACYMAAVPAGTPYAWMGLDLFL